MRWTSCFAVAGFSAILLFTLLSVPATAQVTWDLFDNFNKVSHVNPVNWVGKDYEAQEVIRAISGSALHMSLRSTGIIDAENQLFMRYEKDGLGIKDIIGVKGSLRVNAVTAQGCPGTGSTDSMKVLLGVGGTFFNTSPVGTTFTPGSFVNDMAAYCTIVRHAIDLNKSPMHVVCTVWHYETADGSNPTKIGDTGALLGTIAIGKTAVLSIEWDPPNNQFIFQRDKLPIQTISYDTVSYPNTGYPNVPMKEVMLKKTFPVACSDTTVTVSMDASIDNVYVFAD